MKVDLKGKDYKMVDGFIILTDSKKVFKQRGTCMGVLPEMERYPQSGPEILHLLKSEPKTEPKKEAKKQVDKPKKEKSSKKKLSFKALKGE